MLKVPPPRLLPMTIVALVGLLTLKFSILLQAALSHGPKPDTPIVAVAIAAGIEAARDHGKPPATTEAKLPPPPPVTKGPPPVSESEKILLQQLRQRRSDLDARAEAVAARESILAATEQRLNARVVELQTLQKKLETLDAAQKQKEDAGWQGLVKLYEAMKPKDAATIFNDLAMPVVLQVLDRMKDAKAAPVMAAMNPDKARDITAELARLRTGRTPTTAGG